MTPREGYEAIGENYDDVLDRLVSEAIIVRFNQKFLNVSDYGDLLHSLEEKKYRDAFRAAHNLKGLSLNLGFTKLSEAVTEICEELRGGEPVRDLEPMAAALKSEYEKVIRMIQDMKSDE